MARGSGVERWDRLEHNRLGRAPWERVRKRVAKLLAESLAVPGIRSFDSPLYNEVV